MKSTRLPLYIGLALLCSATLASAIPGRAEVRKIVGRASLIKAGGASSTLAEGMVLGSGDTVATGPGSIVDLWLGLNGDALRIDPDTTLKLDLLDIANVSERRVTTSLSLVQGGVTGNVGNKLSVASKYEVKTANGVAGIRGTIYSLRTDGTLVVARGVVMFTFVLNGAAQTVRVEAGQQFKSGDPAPSPAPPQVVAAVIEAAAQLATNTGMITTNEGTVTVTQNPLDVSTSGQ